MQNGKLNPPIKFSNCKVTHNISNIIQRPQTFNNFYFSFHVFRYSCRRL